MPFSCFSLARVAALACLLSGVTAQAQPVPAASTPPAVPWQVFAAADDRPGRLIPGTARLIFMRPATGIDTSLPADIVVNGRFHTALLPGGFSEASVCPGQVQLSLGGFQAAQRGTVPTLSVEVPSGRTVYVQVHSPQQGIPLVAGMDEDRARIQLQNLRRQTHTLSRLPAPADCPPAPTPPALASAAPVLASAPVLMQAEPEEPGPKRVVLSAEMLFSFGGSKPQHLSEQGHAQIVRLAQRLKSQLRPSQVVVVQGHSDPLGSPALNRRLSLERAQTVGGILINSGLAPRQVRTEGLGASQLLVNNCAEVAPKREARLKCNAPNRRVEVTVRPTRN